MKIIRNSTYNSYFLYNAGFRNGIARAEGRLQRHYFDCAIAAVPVFPTLARGTTETVSQPAENENGRAVENHFR